MSGRTARPGRCAIAWLAALLAAGCSRASITTPTPEPLSLRCPAPIEVEAPLGEPVPVVYAKPAIAGGVLPVTGACSKDAGDAFPIGTTTVSCSVKDAHGQTASCAFAVKVTPPPPPSLRISRILAFGDSITEGVDANVRCGFPTLSFDESFAFLRPRLDSDPWAYPSVLRDLLRSRYPLDTPTIVNSGKAGEYAEQGVERLPGALAASAPDVLLLLHGTNDAVQHYDRDDITGHLHEMIDLAKGRRADVVLSNLIPQKPSCRDYLRPEDVLPVNDAIRALAQRDGVRFVDMFAAFNGDVDGLVGHDGLHPTPAGYRVIAEQFAEALRAYERR